MGGVTEQVRYVQSAVFLYSKSMYLVLLEVLYRGCGTLLHKIVYKPSNSSPDSFEHTSNIVDFPTD